MKGLPCPVSDAKQMVACPCAVKKRTLVLEDSETSGEDQSRTRNAAAASPTKPTPKGTMMEVGTGKKLRSKSTAGPSAADKPAEAQPAAEEGQGPQQPKAAAKNKRGRPPGNKNKPAGAALPLEAQL